MSDSELERLRQQYADFVYRVSHDFSAPLRGMTEFARLLREDHAGSLDAEGQQYLGIIVSSGEKMRAMFDGLLELSRLYSQPPQPERVDLGVVVAELAVVYRARASVTVRDLPVITADRAHMQKLFSVLLDNAALYVSPGERAEIDVSAQQSGGRWLVSVCDRGIGIAPEFHSDIFCIFRRLHKDSAYPGLGVGLAVAQRIAEIYGGTISVKSAEGQGATFTVSLPAA